MRTMICFLLACGCLLGGPITPSSYVATPGTGGTCGYLDDTGTQLTGGVIGSNNVLANLGNGCAYEWVGWWSSNPQITFSFPGSVSIDTVQIGFAHDTSNVVYLPTNVNIGGTSFPLTGNEVGNDLRGWLTFNGSWTGSSLTVNMTQTNNSWIFVDEIKFSSDASSTVPEPATTGMVALACGALLFVTRRRKAV